jgi:DNA-binding transcriptional LysR family regulator
MELRDIEYFSVVAEHRHLGRAAEALGLTQPALSKCLRRLEAILEAKLVRRTPTGVDLTAEGVALATHARRLRLSLNDVAREVRDVTHGRVGHLRIGAVPAMAERALRGPCSAILKDSPRVTFAVSLGSNDTLLPALRNGELDLIVSGIPDAPYEDLAQERLYDEEFAVFASANHRLAKRRKVTIGDLERERWATTASTALTWQWLQRSFENHSLPRPRAVLETSADSLIAVLAASSDLLCFVAKSRIQGTPSDRTLVEIPVKELKWMRHVGVSYRRSAYLSPVARRFIEMLNAAAHNIRG